MTNSLTTLLKAGPPPPQVVLLPDELFFTRAIAVPGGATPTETASLVELALETLSPFPPAQLYHGYYWPTGSERALVFAAYRRRFTAEQSSEWQSAELVVPAFASLLGGTVQSHTTMIVPSAGGLTAIYWDDQPVPAKVTYRPLDAELGDNEAICVRGELLAAVPRNRSFVLDSAPLADASRSDSEMVFRSGDFMSRLPKSVVGAMDVRDKEALAALRRAQSRDVLLWRTFLGFAAVLLLLGIGELALIGASFWQRSRVALANQQRPVVEKIETAQSLTTRINELSTKRLLPFEMISFVTEKKPADVTFVRAATTGLYGLSVEAYTPSPGSVSAFQSALSSEAAFERVEVRDQRTRDNVMTFTIAVTFRSGALKPSAAQP